MFKKILVANRGEIAVRIIRACRELSVPSVAVFSEVDRLGLPVQMADEAVLLGPASPLESYLKIDAIIDSRVLSNICLYSRVLRSISAWPIAWASGLS